MEQVVGNIELGTDHSSYPSDYWCSFWGIILSGDNAKDRLVGCQGQIG